MDSLKSLHLKFESARFGENDTICLINVMKKMKLLIKKMEFKTLKPLSFEVYRNSSPFFHLKNNSKEFES